MVRKRKYKFRTLLLGDIHGRAFWKYIVNTVPHDRVIFIGDYFDSFDIDTTTQINNFLDIIEYKKSSGKEVILLVGNHDHHYVVGDGDTGTSGWQQIGSFQICPVIDANKEHLQMAYRFENVLCTHAGVSEVFMEEVYGKDGWKIDNIVEDLNDLYKYKPRTFMFNGFDPQGDDKCQTPIWIRPGSLIPASKSIRKAGIIQVVGHTKMKFLDIEGSKKHGNGHYFFIDTLTDMTTGEYLIYEDGEFTVGYLK